MNAVPLGTILSWANSPNKNGTHKLDEPNGFAICDGSIILEGMWSGLQLPNLTDGRLLSGGTIDNVLEFEEDMIRNHTHFEAGHTHTDSGHTHFDSGHSINIQISILIPEAVLIT